MTLGLFWQASPDYLLSSDGFRDSWDIVVVVLVCKMLGEKLVVVRLKLLMMYLEYSWC